MAKSGPYSSPTVYENHYGQVRISDGLSVKGWNDSSATLLATVGPDQAFLIHLDSGQVDLLIETMRPEKPSDGA